MERTGRSIEKNEIGIMLFVICVCTYECVGICVCINIHTFLMHFLRKVIHALEKNSINTEEIRQKPQTGSSWKNPASQRALFDSYIVFYF